MSEFKDWWPLYVVILGWIVTAAVGWTKMTSKVNGQGSRVQTNADDLKTLAGTVARMERELTEYRRDASDAARGLARVEKGVDDIHETINQSNLQLGSQLNGIEKLINEKDSRTQIRLTRIETVGKIEEKIGPLPTE